MTFSLPRGTQDILPEDIPKWHLIEQTARNLFSTYNFKEIEPPFLKTQVFLLVEWVKTQKCLTRKCIRLMIKVAAH